MSILQLLTEEGRQGSMYAVYILQHLADLLQLHIYRHGTRGPPRNLPFEASANATPARIPPMCPAESVRAYCIIRIRCQPRLHPLSVLWKATYR